MRDDHDSSLVGGLRDRLSDQAAQLLEGATGREVIKEPGQTRSAPFHLLQLLAIKVFLVGGSDEYLLIRVTEAKTVCDQPPNLLTARPKSTRATLPPPDEEPSF